MKLRISVLMTLAAHVLAATEPNPAPEAAPISAPALIEIMQKSTSQELRDKIAKGELDVNKCDDEGNTPLLMAAGARRSDLMYVLLENGADPNFEKDPGITSLGIACVYDDWSMIDLLITHGANVNYCAPNGESTLSMACAKGAVNAVQMLLAAKATTDVRDAKGATPLIHAIMNHTEYSLSIARMLLEKKADANFSMPNGFSPLMGAVQMNNMDMALLLLEHQADVNARQGADGPSALSIAVALGYSDMVSMLLANKADITIGISPTTSLLGYASMLARADIMEELLKHGAQANSRDSRSLATPLHITATGNALIADSIKLMGNASLVKQHQAHMDAPAACRALLKYGADVNAADIDGTTPLMIAAMDGCTETLSVLLESGANIRATDTQGRTALMLAVMSPEAKADISLSHVSPASATKVKPHVIRSMSQYPDVAGTVKLLLKAGANVQIKDKHGKRAVDYAVDPQVIQLLEAAAQ